MNNVRVKVVRGIFLCIALLSMWLVSTCQFINVAYTAKAVPYSVSSNIYWIINAHSGKALTVYNSGTTAGTNVIQSNNVDGTNQRWNVTTNYNPNYSNQQFTMIMANGTPGLCLSVANSSLSNGVNVELGTTTEINSYWDITQIGTNGNYKITSKCGSTYALTVHNASLNNNANVFAYTYNSGIPCNDEWILVPVAGSALETVTIAVQLDSALQTEYLNNTREVEAIFADAMKPFYNKFHIQLVPSFYTLSTMEADYCPRPFYEGCNSYACEDVSECKNRNETPNHHKNFDFNALRAWNAYGMDGNQLRIILTGFQMCHISDSGSHSLGALGWWPDGRNGMVEINDYNRTYTQNVRVIQHELSHAFGCSHCDDTSCIMYDGNLNTLLDTEETYNLSTIWCSECEADFDRTKF
ncbi:MAG: RICIN domain-containing protein [Oscillospiraceae bacterium]|nr:RICIN domain-containing protein [Oscillospiraceae bacterium]